MFITAIQNAIRRELFRGSMHRGKYRYVRPIKLKEMNLLREEYKREERVTQLLLNPYLTQVSKYLKKGTSNFKSLNLTKEWKTLMNLYFSFNDHFLKIGRIVWSYTFI